MRFSSDRIEVACALKAASELGGVLRVMGLSKRPDALCEERP